MKWFMHDTDASSDAKLEKLIMKFGADGYATYFYCLECIARPIDKTHLSFELEHDAETIGHKFKIDTLRVEDIMKYCIHLGLFQYNEVTHKVSCIGIAKRLMNSIVKNPQLAELQKKLKDSPMGEMIKIPDNPGLSETISENPGQTRLDYKRLNNIYTFKPPSLEEVSTYIKEKKYSIDPEYFINYQTARGWVLSNGKKMKCWKSTLAYWNSRNKQDEPKRDDDYVF